MDTPHICRTILLSLNQLRLKEELCDVQLLVDDVQLSAHRVVLAATSPFFRQLIGSQQRTCSCQVFKLGGINKAEMLTVLDFLYTGQISITASKIKTMINIATELKIPLLLAHCRSWSSRKPQASPQSHSLPPDSPVGGAAKMKERRSTQPQPVIPSTYARASALLQSYRSQTKASHSYCLQKDLLDITADKSTVNIPGSTISAVGDLSVCCQLQTQSDEMNNGQGRYGMYGACTDTCCGEVISQENIKQEIKEEPEDPTQNCDMMKETPKDLTQNCNKIKEEPKDQNCDSPPYQNQVCPESLELSLQTAKLESVDDVSKADVQLQHALMQITQNEALSRLGVQAQKDGSGSDNRIEKINTFVKNEGAKEESGKFVKNVDDSKETDHSIRTSDGVMVQEKQQHSTHSRGTAKISVAKSLQSCISGPKGVCCKEPQLDASTMFPGTNTESGIVSGMASSSVDSTNDTTTGSTTTRTPELLNQDTRLRVQSFRCCRCDDLCDCITKKKSDMDSRTKSTDGNSLCSLSNPHTSKSKVSLKRNQETECKGNWKRSKVHETEPQPQTQEANEQERDEYKAYRS